MFSKGTPGNLGEPLVSLSKRKVEGVPCVKRELPVLTESFHTSASLFAGTQRWKKARYREGSHRRTDLRRIRGSLSGT